MKRDIFCTIPKIGILVFLNILMPFTASFRAISCGVEIIIAPEFISDGLPRKDDNYHQERFAV